MNKKKKVVRIYVNVKGLTDCEVESLKSKFCFFASNLDSIFDLDYICVSEMKERRNDL